MADGPVHALLVKPPAGAVIPGPVRVLTGIAEADSSRGIAVAEAAHLVRKALSEGFPVAHHALYEGKWLRWLTGMDLDGFVCTREMAAKRLPHLPAYGLRAVAGYLGYALSPLRRAGDHVRATRFIWRNLPKVSELCRTRVSRDVWLSAPDAPGVYRLLDSRGNALYVGKSQSLRKRLSSWFTGSLRGMAGELAARTHRVSVTVCPCSFTASMLEARLILELSPPCNTAGRLSGERCAYLGPDWRLYNTEPGDMVFRGPFPSIASVQGLLLARRLLQGEEPGEYAGVIREWREMCEGRNLFRLGLEQFRREEPEEPTGLDTLIKGVVTGAFHARRAAALRLLRGSTVEWDGGTISDPLAWPVPEGELKLLAALLAGLRKLVKGKLNPRVETRAGKRVSAEQINGLLDVV